MVEIISCTIYLSNCIQFLLRNLVFFCIAERVFHGNKVVKMSLFTIWFNAQMTHLTILQPFIEPIVYRLTWVNFDCHGCGSKCQEHFFHWLPRKFPPIAILLRFSCFNKSWRVLFLPVKSVQWFNWLFPFYLYTNLKLIQIHWHHSLFLWKQKQARIFPILLIRWKLLEIDISISCHTIILLNEQINQVCL